MGGTTEAVREGPKCYDESCRGPVAYAVTDVGYCASCGKRQPKKRPRPEEQAW